MSDYRLGKVIRLQFEMEDGTRIDLDGIATADLKIEDQTLDHRSFSGRLIGEYLVDRKTTLSFDILGGVSLTIPSEDNPIAQSLAYGLQRGGVRVIKVKRRGLKK